MKTCENCAYRDGTDCYVGMEDGPCAMHLYANAEDAIADAAEKDAEGNGFAVIRNGKGYSIVDPMGG